jgi:tetratricopeptide (TPR) repeat protein
LQGGGSLSDPFQTALAHREAQDLEAAYAAIRRGDPNDPRVVSLHAQISLETGRPAADLFAAARALDESNPTLIRNHAAALAEEGDWAGAVALLETTLAQHPAWLDGHRLLANLRITGGEGARAAESYAAAAAKDPANLSIRLAWFQTLAMQRDWDAARAVVDARYGNAAGLRSARVFIESESGADATDAALFDAVADIADVGLDIARVRHALRLGNIPHAAAVAESHIGSASIPAFWPYLSIIWRLTDDPRAAWLDGDPPTVKAFDLDFAPGELATLAETLRTLHRAKAPYPEQSVRGGTQTSGQLFFHHDPAIQAVRGKVMAAVADYIATLPRSDAAHPLLGPARDQPIRFEGSWSVRLAAQGFHSVHTHIRGWISSALYIALPDAMGPAPAGWIEFGKPTPELNLSLAAYTQAEPKPGRLVLFPSTLWHGTMPFDDGERLTIAVDVAIPKSGPPRAG